MARLRDKKTGRVIEVNLPKDFEFDKARKVQQTGFLPQRQLVEDLISKRDDLLQSALQRSQGPRSLIPFGREFNVGLQTIGGGFQRAEAALANPALTLQAGDVGTNLFDEMVAGIKGERLGEFGDVLRTTGFGGRANPLISVISGFANLVGATNLATKGKLVESANKVQAAATKGLRRRAVRKAREMGLVHMIGKTAPESYFLEVNDLDSLVIAINRMVPFKGLELSNVDGKEFFKKMWDEEKHKVGNRFKRKITKYLKEYELDDGFLKIGAA